jgi:hypothetical protein
LQRNVPKQLVPITIDCPRLPFVRQKALASKQRIGGYSGNGSRARLRHDSWLRQISTLTDPSDASEIGKQC